MFPFTDIVNFVIAYGLAFANRRKPVAHKRLMLLSGMLMIDPAAARLVGTLNRRSLIILQTEFVDTTTAELMLENLARLASRHVVLFVALRDPDIDRTIDAPPRTLEDVTRSVIAEDFARERLVVFERLRRPGLKNSYL